MKIDITLYGPKVSNYLVWAVKIDITLYGPKVSNYLVWNARED